MSELNLKITKAGNGFHISADDGSSGEGMVAHTETEARLYLESWVTSWFKDNEVERIREVR